MTDIKRYELFGWDYDRYNPPDPKAVAWYLGHLERSGGPVLELACGGGTLLEPIAAAGFEVTGLDLSETMLGRARRRIAGLPQETAARIRLVKGDMSDFDLGETFRTAILADNSFRELPTVPELLDCLRCIRRHLADGGLFLLTEARFNPDLYVDGRRCWPWTKVYENEETGESVRRRVILKALTDPRRIEGLMIYERTDAAGSTSIEECPYVAPILTPPEYLSLLAEAGFEAELRVGYEDRPDDGVEPLLCFVATIAG
jgi:SAM-dependent methyltransferase